MKERKASVKDKIHPDLLEPPHVVDRLVDIVMGEWQLAPSEKEQLITHLTECSHCRTALLLLLSIEQEDERLNSDSGTPAHDLLTRFITIHHEIEAQDYEQMGAYAEAIVAKGREEAEKHFPILAEHVKTCASCKSTLEETLAFLNETEETT